MSKPRRGKQKKPKPPRPRTKLDRQLTKSRLNKVSVDELIAEDILPSIDQVENTTGRSEGRVTSGDSGKLLTDNHRVRGDTRLVNMAVRKGWNVKRKNMLRRRLENIAQKTTAEVVTKQGVVNLESKADELAINAIKVLVSMNQSDIDLEKLNKDIPPTPPSVVIQNNVNTIDSAVEQRRIELARLARKFGARSVLIDGRQIPIADILGSTDEVPSVEGSVEPEHPPATDPASP